MTTLARPHIAARTMLFGMILGSLLLFARSADAQAQFDRLRILNQNIMNKPTNFAESYGICADDNECRSRKISEAILEADYDVVVFQEEFERNSTTELIRLLSPTFPYYAAKFDADPIAAPWIFAWEAELWSAMGWFYFPPPEIPIGATIFLESFTKQTSGLAIFSKYEMLPLNGDCNTGRGAISYLDNHTQALLDDEGQVSPVAYLMYNDCYRLPACNGNLLSAYNGCDFEKASDCFAAKGVGAVRLRSPTDRIYNIIFTHPQAAYGGNVEQIEYRNVRRLQFAVVNDMIACLHVNHAEEEIVLVGDLNVNGDQLVQNEAQNGWKNDEWTQLFDQGPPPGAGNSTFFFNAPQLKDSWAYDMHGHNAYAADAQAGSGLDRGVTWKGGTGCTEADGGIAQPCSDVNGRLDFVFHSPASNPHNAAGQPRSRMAVHHTALSYNAFGNRPDAGALNGITSATSPGTQIKAGTGEIADHIGISAEIAPATLYHSPETAYVINPETRCEGNFCKSNGICDKTPQACVNSSDCTDCLGIEWNTIDAPGAAVWYRIDSPGTYTFRVNHMWDMWAQTVAQKELANNGMALPRVYLPTDLSRGLESFGTLLSTSDPSGPCDPDSARYPNKDGNNASGCEFSAATYTVTEAPFYVKVWYDKSKADALAEAYPYTFDFTWQRNSCEKKGQACTLYPSQVMPPALSRWLDTSDNERWYAIRIDQTDHAGDGALQHLRFDANTLYWPLHPTIDKLSLVRQDESEVASTQTAVPYQHQDALVYSHFQMFSSNNLGDPPDPSLTSVGTLDGDDNIFFLVAHRSPTNSLTFDYSMRWDTDLSWFMDAKNAHKPKGVPVWNWELRLNGETQDSWPNSEDELGLYVCEEGDQPGHCAYRYQEPDWKDKDHRPPMFFEPFLNYQKGFRYQTQLVGRVVEWDDGFNPSASDFAPWGAFGPFVPASDLGPGVPNPLTANVLVRWSQAFSVGWWNSNDGDYFLDGNQANSSPAKFCWYRPQPPPQPEPPGWPCPTGFMCNCAYVCVPCDSPQCQSCTVQP